MLGRTQNYTDYTCLTFLRCVFSNAFSKHFHKRMQSHTGCIFLLFSSVFFQMFPQITCLGGCIFTLVAYVWLFSTVSFQMAPQMACLRGCIVTLVTFVQFFSTVCFQMSPQMACLKGCIFTLVTLVWLVSTVCFQMCPQMACMRGCIITLVAFVRLFSTVNFQMFPQITCLRGCIFTLITFLCFFPTVNFWMGPQSLWPRWCKIALAALVCLFSTVHCHMFLHMIMVKWGIITLAALVNIPSFACFVQPNFWKWIFHADHTVATILLHCSLNLSDLFDITESPKAGGKSESITRIAKISRFLTSKFGGCLVFFPSNMSIRTWSWILSIHCNGWSLQLTSNQVGGKVSAVLEVQLGLPADLRPGDAARREAWRKRRQEAQSFLPVFQPPPPPTPPPPPPPPPPVDPPTVVREKTSASAPVLEGALPLDPVEATPPLPAPEGVSSPASPPTLSLVCDLPRLYQCDAVLRGRPCEKFFSTKDDVDAHGMSVHGLKGCWYYRG